MIRFMRRMFWITAAGGLALGGWSFWKLRGKTDELPQGNWSPVPAPPKNDGNADRGAAAPDKARSPGKTVAPDSNNENDGDESPGPQGFASPMGAPAPDPTHRPSTADNPTDASEGGARSSAAGGSTSEKPTTDQKWVAPDENGSCPVDFAIKANDGSKIYHLPTGRSYRRTKAERCYANPEDAAADGYRAAKA